MNRNEKIEKLAQASNYMATRIANGGPANIEDGKLYRGTVTRKPVDAFGHVLSRAGLLDEAKSDVNAIQALGSVLKLDPQYIPTQVRNVLTDLTVASDTYGPSDRQRLVRNFRRLATALRTCRKFMHKPHVTRMTRTTGSISY